MCQEMSEENRLVYPRRIAVNTEHLHSEPDDPPETAPYSHATSIRTVGSSPLHATARRRSGCVVAGIYIFNI